MRGHARSSTLLVVLAGFLLGACLTPGPNIEATRVEPTTSTTDPDEGPPQAEIETVLVGERVTTAAGNAVAVRRVEVDDGEGPKQVFVDVEACAVADATDPVGVAPQRFNLLLDGDLVALPAPEGREPRLTTQEIPAGACVDGWITYVVDQAADPVAVVLRASSTIRWELGDG